MTYTFDVTFRHGVRDFRVTGQYSPARPGRWSEHDGGTPPEPAELDDCKIYLVAGKRERLLQDDDGKMFDELYNDILDQIADL